VVTEVGTVPRLPARPRDGHKGTFGTLVLVAGRDGMLGAAILGARGALRGGAGLCRVSLPGDLRAPFTVAVPAATTFGREPADLAAGLASADAVVAGPGLGTDAAAREALDAVLRAARPTVLDADALNLLAPLRGSLAFPAILSPHPGEAGRLLGIETAAVQRDRRGSALELAARSGAVVVLKGAGTIVTDGERLFVNRTGNPGLGTGGSGDVLAGLLGALLAQRMAAFDAACLGVHVHGAAGDRVAARLSEPGLCAEDLPLAIAEELSSWSAR
jgi:NAD(P)H-hydrate epimerase